MSDLTRYDGLPEMNKEEAEEYDQEICATMNEWAIRTFVFKIRKGYKALGFNSFDDWCESRTTMTRRTVDNWMMRVSVVLQGNCFDLSDTAKVENVFHFSGQLLPFETSQVLYSLPPEKFVEAWSLLYQGGAANLPPKQQLEAINRWRNRTGQIEPSPPPKPKFYCIECGGERVANEGDKCENCKDFKPSILTEVVDPPAPNTVNPGPWCGMCGEPCGDEGTLCLSCQEKKKVEADICDKCKAVRRADGYDLCPTCRDTEASPVVGFKVEGQSVERVTHAAPTRLVEATRDTPAYLRQTPPSGLTDNGRQVIGAVCAIPTDDPEIVYIRCVVPMGMTITEDQLLTVAVVRCQMP